MATRSEIVLGPKDYADKLRAIRKRFAGNKAAIVSNSEAVASLLASSDLKTTLEAIKDIDADASEPAIKADMTELEKEATAFKATIDALIATAEFTA